MDERGADTEADDALPGIGQTFTLGKRQRGRSEVFYDSRGAPIPQATVEDAGDRHARRLLLA